MSVYGFLSGRVLGWLIPRRQRKILQTPAPARIGPAALLARRNDRPCFVPGISPFSATAGQPGPSRLAREIDPQQFREILRAGHNRIFQKCG